MDDLLAHPAVQGGALPFLVALAIGWIPGRRWPALAIGAALAVTGAFVLGWNFEALNSARKLALVGIASAAVAAIARDRLDDTRFRIAVGGAAGCAMLWVASGVLRQMSASEFALPAAAIFAFTALLVIDPMRPAQPRTATAVASVALSFCAGVVALLGASAVLALMAIATGAAAAALVLLRLLPSRARTHLDAASIHLPCAVITAGVAAMACLTGGVPWWDVLPLLAVPWLARTAGQLIHPFISQETI